jgi:hypothetical protein
MQIDMHFYGVYALARAAGIKPDSAHTIAYASQFVDDALEGEVNILPNHQAVFPIVTSHKPIDYQNAMFRDQWKVWVSFHFLPGNLKAGRSFYEKMQCLKATESQTAGKILEHALARKSKPYGAHLAGVTAHVYADTFAHYGFVGLSADWNKVKYGSVKASPSHSSRIKNYVAGKFENFKIRIAGTFAESVPVGHGAVATYPDRPYLRWKYVREKNRKEVSRNNPKDFLMGCEHLYNFFVEFVTDNPTHGKPAAREFGDIRAKVEAVLKKEGKKQDRIKQWKSAIANNSLFQATQKDKRVKYDESVWEYHRINKHLAVNQTLDNCHASHFIHAAWKHRNYVLYELLPEVGLMAS